MVFGMVYVIKGKACLMIKAKLRALGCLPEKFPEAGMFIHPYSNIAAGTNSVGEETPEEGHADQEPFRQPEGECDPDTNATPLRVS